VLKTLLIKEIKKSTVFLKYNHLYKPR